MNSLSSLSVDALFQCIDRLTPEFYELLKKIVAIESPSPDRDAVNQVGNYIAEFAKRKGFFVSWQPFAKSGNGLVLSFPGERDQKPVCFTAHLDTVHKKGAFLKMLVEEDGFLYGPGVVDCKGGIAVALLTMTALYQTQISRRPLKLVLTPDEEISNSLSEQEGIDFIRRETRDCVAAITCECGASGEAVVERKGIFKGDITITGKSAHAGMHYDQGQSAIREAARKILELEALSDMEHITYNCGIIRGGSAYNVVPNQCVIGVDIRFCNPAERDESIRLLEEIVRHSYVKGTSSSFEILDERPLMPRSDEGMELFRLLQKTGEEYQLEKLIPCPNGGGSDAAYSAEVGTPSICGMGMTGYDWHSPEERVEIASLPRRAKLLAAAVAQME